MQLYAILRRNVLSGVTGRGRTMIVRLTAALLVVVLALASGIAATPTAAAEPAVSVQSVSYPPGACCLNVTLTIPRSIDDAARSGNVPYGLRVQVSYISDSSTGENFEMVTPVSATTSLCELPTFCDADTVAVLVQVSIGDRPPPGANPNLAVSVELLEPDMTPAALCQRTIGFVQASDRYQALSTARQAKVDALADALCDWLAAIEGNLTPAQKAKFVKLYKLGVDVLVRSGWLTTDQGVTLRTLADEL